jgi:hypothetical protein
MKLGAIYSKLSRYVTTSSLTDPDTSGCLTYCEAFKSITIRHLLAAIRGVQNHLQNRELVNSLEEGKGG